MDRMQPPPNYYGPPYQPEQPTNGYPPMQGNPYMGPTPPPPNIPRAEAKDNTPQGQDIYEQLQNPPGPNSIFFTNTCKTHTGKMVIVYCTFPDSAKWHDVEFKGKLILSGDDHIVIEDERAPGAQTIIVGTYINFIEVMNEKK